MTTVTCPPSCAAVETVVAPALRRWPAPRRRWSRQIEDGVGVVSGAATDSQRLFDDVVNFPRRMTAATPPRRRCVRRSDCGLADQLDWSTEKVEGLLGRSSDRPRLTLVPADQ